MRTHSLAVIEPAIAAPEQNVLFRPIVRAWEQMEKQRAAQAHDTVRSGESARRAVSSVEYGLD